MKVLIVTDLLNDFCPPNRACANPALPVAEAHEIVPVVNRLMLEGDYDLVVALQEAHPENHGSFFTQHPGAVPFTLGTLDGLPQVYWPPHGRAGTIGAAFHPDLRTDLIDCVVPKGKNPLVDSYSGFYDNGRREETELRSILSRLVGGDKNLSTITADVVGLCGDYCVGFTAHHGLDLHMKVRLIIDAIRSVNIKPTDEMDMYRSLAERGAVFATSREIISEVPKSRVQREIPLTAG